MIRSYIALAIFLIIMGIVGRMDADAEHERYHTPTTPTTKEISTP